MADPKKSSPINDTNHTHKNGKQKPKKKPGYIRRAVGALLLLGLVCVIYLLYGHYRETGRLFNFQDKDDVQRMIAKSKKEADKLLCKADKLSKQALVSFNDAIDVSADKLSELREKIGSEETTQQLMTRAKAYLDEASKLLENSDKEVKLRDSEKEFKDSLSVIQQDRKQAQAAKKKPETTKDAAADTPATSPEKTVTDAQKPIQIAMKTPDPEPVTPAPDEPLKKKQPGNETGAEQDGLRVAKVEVSGETPVEKTEDKPAEQPKTESVSDKNWQNGRKYFGMGLAHYRKSGPDMKNGYEHLKRATVFFKRAQICLRKADSKSRNEDEFARVEMDTNRFLYDCLKRTKVFESR